MNPSRNPRLTANARTLRKHMTPEERHLWYDFLKDLPVTVNRQKVLGRYIADFYCAAAKSLSNRMAVSTINRRPWRQTVSGMRS